jgi:hypothetical protein
MNYKQQKTDGINAEMRFLFDALSSYNYWQPVQIATPEQNKLEKWDIELNWQKIDVKAALKVNRSDFNANYEYRWIELKGITGELGSLYGLADWFAFEGLEAWIMVRKTKLQAFIAEKCKSKERCTTPELYKLYTREGRKDVIVLVEMSELVKLSEWKFLKKV